MKYLRILTVWLGVFQWRNLLLLSPVILIAYATLYPYEFSFPSQFSWSGVDEIFRFLQAPWSTFPSDVFNNSLLFAPFGFVLADWLKRKAIRIPLAILIIGLLSASLSFTVETLQTFLPSRSSSLSDIVLNTSGALLGFACFHLMGEKLLFLASKFLTWVRSRLSVKHLTAAFISYFSLMVLLSLLLLNSTNLSRFDPALPLVLGNEATGDRHWQGTITTLDIADRALSAETVQRVFIEGNLFTSFRDSLVASYDLTVAKLSYRDRTSHIPDLIWVGDAAKQQRNDAFLSSKHWLQTALPATTLTERLSKSSQFTMSTIIATGDPNPKAQQRIISLSQDAGHRNFTLGQQGNQLSLRLRTTTMVANATQPELFIPNFFKDTKPHHLIVTYDGVMIRLYVDNFKNSYALPLAPEIALFRFLFPQEYWRTRLDASYLEIYRIVYYGVICMPLGVLLAFITKYLKGNLLFYVLLMIGGIIAPVFLLDCLLAIEIGRSLSVNNLLLSSSILLLTLVCCRTLNQRSRFN